METPENPNVFFSDVIEKIRLKIPLHLVILFGSRARGDAKFYSDFDFLIVADFKEPYLDRVKWVLWEAPAIPLDVFCYTPQEFEKMFNSYRLTAIDAIGDGIILYGEDFAKPYKKKYANFVKHGMRKTKCILIPPSL